MTVSFGQDHVFPRQAVEYIPLYVETLAQGEILANDVPTGLVVMDTATEAKKRVGILLEGNGSLELPEDEGYLFILACNLAVRIAKYRGTAVTMLGDLRPDRFHLFRLPNKFFYKSRLVFEVYNSLAQRLTWAAYQTPAPAT